MKVRDWLQEATQRLASASLQCADPRLHAQQILESVAGWTTAQVLSRNDDGLDSYLVPKLESFLARRCTGEPFQYILGRESFWKDEFHVGPGVLIPRRETEHVVEFLSGLKIPGARVVELGAGSANIGVSTLREQRGWRWVACEQSPDAFTFARKNIESCLGKDAAVVERVPATLAAGSYTLIPGDFFTIAPQGAPWDAVVSNPPYVATSEIPTLSKEVRKEPTMALDGGADGLDFVRLLAQESRKLLKLGGWLVLEIGSDQKSEGLEIFANLGYEEVRVVNDLAGLPRVLTGHI